MELRGGPGLFVACTMDHASTHSHLAVQTPRVSAANMRLFLTDKLQAVAEERSDLSLYELEDLAGLFE